MIYNKLILDGSLAQKQGPPFVKKFFVFSLILQHFPQGLAN